MPGNYKRKYTDEERREINSKMFKVFAERDKEKLEALRRKWREENPDKLVERGKLMLDRGGNDARIKTQKDRLALRDKARELGFHIDTRINNDSMTKANKYFDCLKRKREELKKKSQ